MAVIFVNSSCTAAGACMTTSWQHTVAAVASPLVEISLSWSGSSAVPCSVALGGSIFTNGGSFQQVDNRVAKWYKTGLAAGTYTACVVMQSGTMDANKCAAITFGQVNQLTPYGTASFHGATTGNAACATVTASDGGALSDVLSKSASVGETITACPLQVVVTACQGIGSDTHVSYMAPTPGAATVAGWTFSGSGKRFAYMAIPLMPTPVSGGTTVIWVMFRRWVRRLVRPRGEQTGSLVWIPGLGTIAAHRLQESMEI